MTFGALRSEWVKLWSLRAPVWAVATAGVAVVAGGMLAAGAAPPGVDPLVARLEGVQYARFAVAVLGVLVATSEYSSGLMRWTFAAVPARWPVLVAKAVVVGGVTALVALVTVPVAVFAGGPGPVSPGDAGVLTALGGAVGQLVGIAVFALGTGALVRNAAAGIGIVIGAVAILPGLIGTVSADAARFVPGRAGEAMMTDTFWPNAAILLAWAAAGLAGAAYLLRRRDA
ncbi:ABC transporter permease [Cryptosporangium japonicum]|uniref:ABC transporter permease n=1 Tax=Cryptosporangium japonicum TaxID=80872 RepID=A0ABN0U8K5_9ACTN